MSNQTSTYEADKLDAVLTRWKAAVDAHQPEHVAALFTTDAIFQGLHPYTVGPAGVAEYYAAQPRGMTAVYTLRETRALSDRLVLGYLTVDFGFFGHTRVLQDGNDQAQGCGHENDPDEQRAFDNARCVKHDTDDQGEQRAQTER
jgi:hypothetical protein